MRGFLQVKENIAWKQQFPWKYTMTETKKDENIIFIGSKPLMSYATGIVMQFTNNKEVIVKARGKFISTAVDAIEVARKRFLKDQNISVKEVRIDSEEFENKEGKKVNVSIIEITLSKK